MKGIDELGSLERLRSPLSNVIASSFADWEVINLSELGAWCVPAPSKHGRHEWRDPRGVIRTTEFTPMGQEFETTDALQRYLRSEGIVRLMLALKLPQSTRGIIALVMRFTPPAPEYFRSVLLPRPWATWLEPAVDPSRFPHTCPACEAPAYIGLRTVECSEAGCPGR